MRRSYVIEVNLLDPSGDMTPEDVALMLDCFFGKRHGGDPDLQPRDFDGQEGVRVYELSEDDPRATPTLARMLMDTEDLDPGDPHDAAELTRRAKGTT